MTVKRGRLSLHLGTVPDADSAHAQVVRKAGIASLAVSFSRVTGLVREMVFAGLFGAGMQYDAFVAAYRIPNLLRDLLAEGAMSAAFVTTYSQTLSTKGKEEAYALSNRLTTLLVPVLIAICVLGTVFAPTLVNFIFRGYAEIAGKFELTVLLTRVMMPFLLFIALAAKAMGCAQFSRQVRYSGPVFRLLQHHVCRCRTPARVCCRVQTGHRANRRHSHRHPVRWRRAIHLPDTRPPTYRAPLPSDGGNL